MILAKIAKYPKILLVFDKPQSKLWVDQQKITTDGIGAILSKFALSGIDIVNEVSAVCLADSMVPKAVDFNAKAAYVQELIETYAFNLVIPVGAGAFDKVMGFKGVEKYFEKTLHCEKFNCKILPCPLPSMIKFKPEIVGVINNTATIAKDEMEFPDVRKAEKVPTHYHIIDSIAKFQRFMEVFSEVEAFAFDLETTGFQHNVDNILTAQFTHKEGFSYLIPTDFYNQPYLGKEVWNESEWSYIINNLQKLFARKDVIIIGHNIKFDLKFINHWWKVPVPKAKNVHDTLAMSFLIDENTPNDLKHQACVNTDLGDYERELDNWKKDYVKKNKIKTSEFSYSFIPFDILTQYALTDTDATFRLWKMFMPIIVSEEQQKPFEMLMRFSYATTRMELNGWPCDIAYAKGYLEELGDKIVALEKDLMQHPNIKLATRILEVAELNKINLKRKNRLSELPTPFEFNLGSNNHKRVLFFTVMKLPIVKYTKARTAEGKRETPSTDKEVIEKWSFDYPKVAEFLDMLKTYNELCKMKSTYVESIINKSVDGRIFATYNICGAKTGRLSSKNPNFQNLPVRNAEAKNVKRIIKARKGYVLMGADLAAAEMRWACICAGDEKLKEIFLEGLDIHGAIAKEVFNLPCHANEVKYQYPELRDISKTIQFLTLYGGGAPTLASKVKIKPKRAEQILEEAKGNWEYLVDKFQIGEDKAKAVMESRDKISALMKEFTISPERAQEILDAYFEKYPGVKQYIEDTIEFVKQNGYSLSLLGRKRRVSAVDSSDAGIAERAIRQAVNSTIQSVASDGLMESAYMFQEYLDEHPELPILILGPVHDALYLEVREDFVPQARKMLLQFLTTFPAAINSPIPMKADAEGGYDWAHFDEHFGETLSVAVDEVEDEEEED